MESHGQESHKNIMGVHWGKGGGRGKRRGGGRGGGRRGGGEKCDKNDVCVYTRLPGEGQWMG